jgi:hypothetical protein
VPEARGPGAELTGGEGSGELSSSGDDRGDRFVVRYESDVHLRHPSGQNADGRLDLERPPLVADASPNLPTAGCDGNAAS